MSQLRALSVTRRAEREIRVGAAWWREHRPGAPTAYRDDLARAFELIAAYPGIGARARNPALAGVRRVHLSRLGYHLYYRFDDSSVEVLAFWHARRRTEPSL